MFRWLNRKTGASTSDASTSDRASQASGQDRPDAHFDVASLNLEQFSPAEAAYVEMLQADTNNVVALKRLSALAAEQGRDAQAVALISRAIGIDPKDADSHFNLGKIHLDRDRNDIAVSCFEAALKYKPDHAEAHYKLGNALRNQGKLDEALACYRKAVLFKPAYAEAYNNMGVVHQEQKRIADAISCYQKAVALNPTLANAQFNLAVLPLAEGSNPAEALGSLEKAIALDPGIAGSRLADIYHDLGISFQAHGKLSDALAGYQKAIAIDPDHPLVYNNLGLTFAQFGRHDEAVKALRRAIVINPDFAVAHSNLLFCLSHDANFSPEAVFAEHCAFGDHFEGPFRDAWPSHANLRDRERKLRVGFVSADLRTHAVATFLQPIWTELDKRQFEIWVYSNHMHEDAVTQRLKQSAHAWSNVCKLNEDDLSAKILEDRIDILFDLSGHTADNRLLAFARKPAPIQVSWIGNPNTTGLKAMDYYIADRFSAPPGLLDQFFIEKIVQLPSGALFQPFDPSPAVNELPALSGGAFTFGSFNRSDKLTDSVVLLWCKVLKSVPGSRLLLGGVSDAAQQENLASTFSRHDVSRSQLDFYPRTDMAAYLALHHKVDLILDTFPFGGGTTSCHAAWMGVPVLSLAGKAMSSRVGVIINSNLGLTDFIAESEADFVGKAVLWSQQTRELAALRSELRSTLMASPLCQPQLVARWIETALRTMWHRWCDGLPPDSFAVKP